MGWIRAGPEPHSIHFFAQHIFAIKVFYLNNGSPLFNEGTGGDYLAVIVPHDEQTVHVPSRQNSEPNIPRKSAATR